MFWILCWMHAIQNFHGLLCLVCFHFQASFVVLGRDLKPLNSKVFSNQKTSGFFGISLHTWTFKGVPFKPYGMVNWHPLGTIWHPFSRCWYLLLLTHNSRLTNFHFWAVGGVAWISPNLIDQSLMFFVTPPQNLTQIAPEHGWMLGNYGWNNFFGLSVIF